MNGDGLLDVVAARSPFQPQVSTSMALRSISLKLFGSLFSLTSFSLDWFQLFSFAPFGELVLFENPGHDAILKGNGWPERLIYGFPFLNNFGPDIAIKMHDFDNDNVPEFVTTSLFGDKIMLFGAPCDDNGECSWSKANQFSNPPRVVDISSDQGNPVRFRMCYEFSIAPLTQSSNMMAPSDSTIVWYRDCGLEWGRQSRCSGNESSKWSRL